MAGKGGLDVQAGVDRADVEELTRGEGGYEGGAQGEARRGGGGYNGGAVGGSAGSESEGAVRVQERIEALEKKIKELEEKLNANKQESNKYELVNVKNMTPTVLMEPSSPSSIATIIHEIFSKNESNLDFKQ